jgi:hypothetical protein
MRDEEKAHWEKWLEENKGVMFTMPWYRVILDEAQYIPFPAL